jgi:hypothetical protein
MKKCDELSEHRGMKVEQGRAIHKTLQLYPTIELSNLLTNLILWGEYDGL